MQCVCRAKTLKITTMIIEPFAAIIRTTTTTTTTTLLCFHAEIIEINQKISGMGGTGDGFPPLSRTPPAWQSHPFPPPSRFLAED